MQWRNKSARQFGAVARAAALVSAVGGAVLYQTVLRDYVPPSAFGDGWHDWNRGFGAGFVGGVSGLLGAALGVMLERFLGD